MTDSLTTISPLRSLFRSLGTLNGVGEKTQEHFKRLLGSRVIDLLFHLPVSIINRPPISDLRHVVDGSVITITITVGEHRPPARVSRYSKKPYLVQCMHETGDITVVFFKTFPNQVQKLLPPGQKRIISGKVEWSYNHFQMTHPDYILPADAASRLQQNEPVYPLTGGLTSKMLHKSIREILDTMPHLSEWLDPAFIAQKRWPAWHEAFYAVHHPQLERDVQVFAPARQRLAYDELLANQLALQLTRERVHKTGGLSIKGDGSLRKTVLEHLGFTLTQGQQEVIKQINADQESDLRMMRLLQGDVGSGKTAVALFAILNAIEAGKQAALMAPTEILARQHAAWIGKVTAPLGLRVALLTGRVKAKERREILEGLADGSIHIAIGTHALFQEQVQFQDLGIVIIDEQHRFGVEQRMALSEKGQRVDTLLMTATPIPRTLTMTMYGDMDVSRLTDKPAGRQPIDTRLISLAKLDEMFTAVERAVENGEKLYWICPLIEESEAIDLAAAQERFFMLYSRLENKVGLVHGKMPAEERDAVMAAFRDGEIKVLVATTVVEVGVDVPDATIIIIEQAERFGLSQLHQLRGRVGRGSKASRCLLLYNPEIGETARSRLKVMRDTEDGFRIAEEDLAIRGSGDILGTKQSGMPVFHFADLAVHGELLATARKDAEYILHQDPHLQSERGKALMVLMEVFEYQLARFKAL